MSPESTLTQRPGEENCNEGGVGGTEHISSSIFSRVQNTTLPFANVTVYKQNIDGFNVNMIS
jgi:hypothetical protein